MGLATRNCRKFRNQNITMQIVNFDQGSPGWLAWRKSGLGGSDACNIVGKAPWNDPEKLRLEKLGSSRQDGPNTAMMRGIRLEPEARLLFQGLTGLRVRPVCVIHDTIPWLKASLDGITNDYKTFIEIKCPTKLQAHQAALRGRYPDYYKPQIYHCFNVTQADRCIFGSYYPDADKGKQLVLIELHPEPEYQEWLFLREKEFFEDLQKNS